MNSIRWLCKLSSKIVNLSTYCLIAGLLFTIGCDDDDGNKFTLTAEKASDTQNVLTWSPLQGNDGYKIWRMNDDISANTPELVATVDETQYWDQNLPLSTSLSYYVTTTINGNEKKSNIVKATGRSSLNILPYQVKMIPGKTLAIVRDYSSILLLDYHQKVIVKKVDFNGRVGQFAFYTHNGILEVYIPCSDNKLYIMKADELTPIETIDVGKPAFAAVVNNAGKIFCSTSDFSTALQVYDREGLDHVTNIPSESDCGLGLRDDSHLLTVSTHLSPATMTFFTLGEDGSMMSEKEDPYNWDFEMDGNRVKVSSKYVVTSTQGFVYTADEEMTYITKLGTSSNLADFEFSADGATIYSTQTDQRSILKTTFVNNNPTTVTIPTTGYPWVLTRSGNTMLILSSPSPFSPSFMTSSITIETITLQ